MPRFLNPFPQFLKLQNGALQPNSSGYLTFYVNGTSTLADIWTDVDLTLSATNPQELDAEGRMTQNVFISTDLYRVKLTDSNGAVIWDKSNFAVTDTTDADAIIAELESLIESVTSDLFAVNYVSNPAMSVDDADTAGSPVSLTTSYVNNVSGFAGAVLNNVSAGTAHQSTTQIGVSGFSLKYDGVSCTSAGVPALRFRIGNADATSLSNKTLTISLEVKHNVGSAVNYTIATYVANAPDDFSSVTTTGISSTTSVPSGAATTISLTSEFDDVSNGLQVIVSCAPNQALTTKDFYFADVSVSPSAVVLPFRVPQNRAEKYNQIDPDTVLVDGDIATQADQETGTSVTKLVTSGRQKYNRLHPKAVGAYSTAGGTLSTISASGMSFNRTGTGTVEVTLTTAMSSANYEIIPHGSNNGVAYIYTDIESVTASGFVLKTYSIGGSALADVARVSVQVSGDI